MVSSMIESLKKTFGYSKWAVIKHIKKKEIIFSIVGTYCRYRPFVLVHTVLIQYSVHFSLYLQTPKLLSIYRIFFLS